MQRANADTAYWLTYSEITGRGPAYTILDVFAEENITNSVKIPQLFSENILRMLAAIFLIMTTCSINFWQSSVLRGRKENLCSYTNLFNAI